MRQRAMIAMALMGDSQLIIADEPTSSLDVTVQQQILRLLRQVSRDSGSAALVISHDIAVVTELCRRVLVMYAGLIVEDIDVETLLTSPAHPYTRALIASIPMMDTGLDRPLATIPGFPPEPLEVPPGCPFATRCDYADSQCLAERPLLQEISPGHDVACWHPRTEALPLMRAETGSHR
ncbi:MAG: peptide ABC transporter ATP-binding protein, partial [Pseudonocardiales bacterium]